MQTQSETKEGFVVIYSGEHGSYWRENFAGYTHHIEAAGRYTRAEAESATSHCGPEKRIGIRKAPEVSGDLDALIDALVTAGRVLAGGAVTGQQRRDYDKAVGNAFARMQDLAARERLAAGSRYVESGALTEFRELLSAFENSARQPDTGEIDERIALVRARARDLKVFDATPAETSAPSPALAL